MEPSVGAVPACYSIQIPGKHQKHGTVHPFNTASCLQLFCARFLLHSSFMFGYIIVQNSQANRFTVVSFSLCKNAFSSTHG